MADHSVTDIAKEAQISRTSVYAAKNQVIQFAQSLDQYSQDSQTVEITEEFWRVSKLVDKRAFFMPEIP